MSHSLLFPYVVVTVASYGLLVLGAVVDGVASKIARIPPKGDAPDVA